MQITFIKRITFACLSLGPTNEAVQTAVALATKCAIAQGYASATGVPLGMIGLQDGLTRAQAVPMVRTAAHVC